MGWPDVSVMGGPFERHRHQKFSSNLSTLALLLSGLAILANTISLRALVAATFLAGFGRILLKPNSS